MSVFPRLKCFSRRKSKKKERQTAAALAKFYLKSKTEIAFDAWSVFDPCETRSGVVSGTGSITGMGMSKLRLIMSEQ